MFHHMSNRYWLSFKILLCFIVEHILKDTQRAVKEERIIITFGHNRGIKEKSWFPKDTNHGSFDLVDGCCTLKMSYRRLVFELGHTQASQRFTTKILSNTEL